MSFLSDQHDQWRAAMRDAWRRAGIRPGHTVIDLACGEGRAALELAALVGPTGRVRALDLSPAAIAALRASLTASGLTHLTAEEADLNEVDLGVGETDAIWSRWILAFIDDPIDLLERSDEALRPGGVFVSHEYLDAGSWRRASPSPDLDALVLAVSQSWRDEDEDPPAGLEMAVWLDQIGFDLTEVRVVPDGRVAGLVWQWPREFVEAGLARLIAQEAVTADLADEIRREHDAREAHPTAAPGTPAVIEVIASKP